MFTRDEARPDAVQRRRNRHQRTARENIDDLIDPGTFLEYGAFALAAQRRRRSVEELMRMSPADGLVCGVGQVARSQYLIQVIAGLSQPGSVHGHP